jgi:hypothetical protein
VLLLLLMLLLPLLLLLSFPFNVVIAGFLAPLLPLGLLPIGLLLPACSSLLARRAPPWRVSDSRTAVVPPLPPAEAAAAAASCTIESAAVTAVASLPAGVHCKEKRGQSLRRI